jgi:hypothetical protein
VRVLLQVALSAVLSLLVLSTSFAASPVKARPLTGIGILLVKETQPGNDSTLRLYREPKLGRIAEVKVEKLPLLSSYIVAGAGHRVAVVTAKRLGWYRIIYDDGEREGWVEGRHPGTFLRWAEFLPGREATLLPGLKKEFYQLRREPSLTSDPLELLGRENRIYCIGLDGEWLKVLTKGGKAGWLRWRDENSRLLLAVTI